jgi:uncharacterized protein (DUF433 family)
MNDSHSYKHLARRLGSNYRQLFVKGRRIRAEVLYRQTVGTEPRTPEEVAKAYEVPIEAVQEAIHYCNHNESLLRLERDEELQWIGEQGLDKPPHVPADYQPE